MKTVIAAALVILTSCVIDEVRGDDVGEAPGCRATAAWPYDWGAREDELLVAINDARAVGARCGDSDRPPVPDLELAPALRCAARLHAVDQAYAGTLSHDGANGSSTLSRVDLAQYDGVPTHQLLAADYLDPEAVVEAWLGSPDACDGLLDASAAEFGPGFARSQDGGNTAWVLLIGELRD